MGPVAPFKLQQLTGQTPRGQAHYSHCIIMCKYKADKFKEVTSMTAVHVHPAAHCGSPGSTGATRQELTSDGAPCRQGSHTVDVVATWLQQQEWRWNPTKKVHMPEWKQLYHGTNFESEGGSIGITNCSDGISMFQCIEPLHSCCKAPHTQI